MSFSADQITIAVTVFSRRSYVQQSIASALAQTVPVKTMVVEDCSPDTGMQQYIHGLFGSRISYYRSPRRRGIFGNWNTCIEQCKTEWLSILHDDDWLKPEFVEAMLELQRMAGKRGLYYGGTTVVDDQGRPKPNLEEPSLANEWEPVALSDVLLKAPFLFPGQLFNVSAAKRLGGFRDTSLFCGEWELWTKIIAHHGAAQTSRSVAVFRDHGGWTRGTNRIFRSGKTYGLIAVQTKRNLALGRRMNVPVPAEYKQAARFTLPTRYLFRYGRFFTPRMLEYNIHRVLRSRAPHWRYRLLQIMLACFGRPLVKGISHLCYFAQRAFLPGFQLPEPVKLDRTGS